jgi:hypothetical protein
MIRAGKVWHDKVWYSTVCYWGEDGDARTRSQSLEREREAISSDSHGKSRRDMVILS